MPNFNALSKVFCTNFCFVSSGFLTVFHSQSHNRTFLVRVLLFQEVACQTRATSTLDKIRPSFLHLFSFLTIRSHLCCCIAIDLSRTRAA